MKTFAIVVVCYNRLDGVKRLIHSLEKVDYNGRTDIDLIFSIDNSGTRIIEQFAGQYSWPFGKKIVRTFDERQGLKKHILQCGDYTKQYDIVTILEDDLYVSSSMYNYAYNASEFYWDEDSVAGLSLYGFEKNWQSWDYRFEPCKSQYDSYFMKIAMSWGQVWMTHKWKKFMEWYYENEDFEYSKMLPQNLFRWPASSWLKYHDRYCIETNRYFVFPYYSLSTNFSDAGEHSNLGCSDFQTQLQLIEKDIFQFPIFGSNAVKYDEYMNREGLGQHLGVADSDLTVDFYGTKGRVHWKKYLLTTVEYRDTKPEKSFMLSLRPIEASIIENIQGKGIYLYETDKIAKKERTLNDCLFAYYIRISDTRKLVGYSMRMLIQYVKKALGVRIRKKFKMENR